MAHDLDVSGSAPPAGGLPGGQSTARWIVAAVIATLVITGFFVTYGVLNARPKTAPPVVSQVSSVGDLKPGSPAPDFATTGFDGSQVRLSALKGKAVLVNFFASWCTECRAEMPAIQAVYRAKHDAGFEVIGVDTWDSGDGKAFYHQVGATFPAVFDPQRGQQPGAIARAFGIDTPSLPISIFIDREGRVHQVFPGGIDAAIINQQLAQLGV